MLEMYSEMLSCVNIRKYIYPRETNDITFACYRNLSEATLRLNLNRIKQPFVVKDMSLTFIRPATPILLLKMEQP